MGTLYIAGKRFSIGRKIPNGEISLDNAECYSIRVSFDMSLN